MASLRDPDVSVRRRALDLLFTMATPATAVRRGAGALGACLPMRALACLGCPAGGVPLLEHLNEPLGAPLSACPPPARWMWWRSC